MHRRSILDQIDRYTERFPDETAVASRFRDFVEKHPDCLERSLQVGHLTGSAWLVDASGTAILLTHHRKLGIWLQLGGHADGDPDLLRVALREAEEESGLDLIEPVSTGIFDLDVHRIPERKGEPEHFHYDVRFALRHTGSGSFQVSEESHDLAWAPIAEIERYTTEESILRMKRKWQDLQGQDVS